MNESHWAAVFVPLDPRQGLVRAQNGSAAEAGGHHTYLMRLRVGLGGGGSSPSSSLPAGCRAWAGRSERNSSGSESGHSTRSLRHPEAAQGSDWVRPGIAVYGSSTDFPEHSAEDWGLAPVMSLRANIIAVQHLQAGATVGYASTFTASGPMRIGIAACGYADGYPRLAPSGTPVLVDGQRANTVGRVSMDMIAVDITHLPQAGRGSEATLWGGSANGALLSIDEVARAAGTVGYELMCALAPRVPVLVKE